MILESVLQLVHRRPFQRKSLIGWLRFWVWMLLFKPFALFALEASPVKVSGLDIIPTLKLGRYQLDNLTYQPNDTISTGLWVSNPNLKFLIERDRYQLGVVFDYRAGRYTQSQKDDYNDLDLSFTLDWQLSSRNQVAFHSRYQDIHEERGTGFSQGEQALTLVSPDTFRNRWNAIKYQFGADSSKGRLRFIAQSFAKEATSRQDIIAGGDYEESSVGGTFLWSLGGKADTLFEIRHREADYRIDPEEGGAGLGSLDNVGQSFLVGFSWDVTGKTSGSLRVGQVVKDFDSNFRDDFSGFSWEIEAKWAPKQYSVFTLMTSREAREPDAIASYIDVMIIELKWDHNWSQRGRFSLSSSYEDEDYIDSPDSRADSIGGVGINIEYSLRRWFDIGFEFEHNSKDASIPSFEYDANRIGVYFKGSL